MVDLEIVHELVAYLEIFLECKIESHGSRARAHLDSPVFVDEDTKRKEAHNAENGTRQQEEPV